MSPQLVGCLATLVGDLVFTAAKEGRGSWLCGSGVVSDDSVSAKSDVSLGAIRLIGQGWPTKRCKMVGRGTAGCLFLGILQAWSRGEKLAEG